jgi:hypothetical protein
MNTNKGFGKYYNNGKTNEIVFSPEQKEQIIERLTDYRGEKIIDNKNPVTYNEIAKDGYILPYNTDNKDTYVLNIVNQLINVLEPFNIKIEDDIIKTAKIYKIVFSMRGALLFILIQEPNTDRKCTILKIFCDKKNIDAMYSDNIIILNPDIIETDTSKYTILEINPIPANQVGSGTKRNRKRKTKTNKNKRKRTTKNNKMKNKRR